MAYRNRFTDFKPRVYRFPWREICLMPFDCDTRLMLGIKIGELRRAWAVV